jgi:hypothetical protein
MVLRPAAAMLNGTLDNQDSSGRQSLGRFA